jgi:hypothetical protein
MSLVELFPETAPVFYCCFTHLVALAHSFLSKLSIFPHSAFFLSVIVVCSAPFCFFLFLFGVLYKKPLAFRSFVGEGIVNDTIQAEKKKVTSSPYCSLFLFFFFRRLSLSRDAETKKKKNENFVAPPFLRTKKGLTNNCDDKSSPYAICTTSLSQMPYCIQTQPPEQTMRVKIQKKS